MVSVRFWHQLRRKTEQTPGSKSSMKSLLRVNVVVLMLTSLFCSQSIAQSSAREQLNQFAEGLESFSAKFEQRVIGTDGDIQDQSEGMVWLSQPHFIRWEYGGDFPELVVADGSKIWIFDEMLEQVTVKPQSDFAGDSPLSVITDISKLDEQFEVREAGELEDIFLLDLRSVNSESQFDRIILGLRENELVSMTMEDAFGLRTEIHFKELTRNEPLDEKLFAFVPPEGVDVIGNIETEFTDP